MRGMLPCDLCGQSNFEKLFNNHDRMHNIPGDFLVIRCRHCSLVTLDPIPAGPELSKYYPADAYYSLSAPSEKKSILKIFSDYLYRVYFARPGFSISKCIWIGFRPLLRSMIIVPGGTFLDVGCGSGEFMAHVQEFGMQVYGVEPGGFDPSLAKRHNFTIHPGDVFSAHFADNQFDVISLNHVFEHVPSPKAELMELRRILKPGGKIIIAVPNIDSWAFNRFQQYWVNLDTPRHLHNYSPRTLRQYAEAVGLQLTRLRFISTSFQFIGSWLYERNRDQAENTLYRAGWIRRMYNGYSLWLNLLLNLPLLPLAYVLNWFHRGDVVEVIYTKSKQTA